MDCLMADWLLLKRGDAMWYQSEERTNHCVDCRCNFVDARFRWVTAHVNQCHCGNCGGDYQAVVACNQNYKSTRKKPPSTTLTS